MDPKCICGKITVFRKSKNRGTYSASCSIKCRSLDKEYTNSISKRKLELYSNVEWKESTEHKKKNTTLKNYGVEYPMHNIICFEKQQKSAFKKKDNGLQGYEPFIYPFLKNLYEDLIKGVDYLKKTELTISWKDNGKNRRAYPDFFSEEINSFIEIKSDYTLSLHREKLMKCKDRLKELGFGYIVISVNPKKRFAIENFNKDFIKE